ncbi:MAG: prolyl-tRNA synthetase associated domain-containing protein [Rhodospirillales bacterium]|jgi:Ala-tRNA(Pro) deacylase|nr:DNA-binding protein [Rhodospirillaceae bacterium]MDP6426689.1 prolyl-tRNA synthetase associated domain-containing protein [Rhodospirillales bacterium]MDP6642482.1 prolyl-tRNA synthetase associated domain-containing protein [Rhodospirillales bacterium]MDP6841424.1 prolyl-tRNA synthetase associated domain-containing protein [Rhodospirillales bacterium]|tara:strand:+ start:73 stop:561 length:489 start_codon:yes stop_codon:yes gene_type:complete
MPASESELFERLGRLGIETQTKRHAPMFTVEDAKALRGDMPGGHCKSLFLKDKKGALWLAVMLEDKQLDLKALQAKLGSARLSFARPELMRDVLGVEPGSVTPFAVINPSAEAVRVVLDSAMLAHDPLNYHPLGNQATTAIAPDDLLTYLQDCGHQPMIIAL